jgi:hypothetical protein
MVGHKYIVLGKLKQPLLVKYIRALKIPPKGSFLNEKVSQRK